MLLAISLHFLPPLHLLTPSGFFNGMLGVSEPVASNFYTLFHLIPLTLFVSRNLTLIYIPLSGFLDSLLCDLIAPTPGLVFFSTDATPASGSIIIFVRQGLSFSELSTIFLSSLDSYSDYVGVNISTTTPRCHFLMCTPLIFALLRRMVEPTPFLSPFFPFSEISLFWGTVTTIIPSGTQKVLLTTVGRKYSTR